MENKICDRFPIHKVAKKKTLGPLFSPEKKNNEQKYSLCRKKKKKNQ